MFMLTMVNVYVGVGECLTVMNVYVGNSECLCWQQ